MGRERVRSWKHVFFHLACFGAVLLNLNGCVSYPEKRGMEASLSRSGQYLSGEDFQAALTENDKITKSSDRLGAHAMFQRGLIYAHPNNPDRDYEKAQVCFQQVVQDSPGEETAGQAKVLMLLLSKLMEMEYEESALREKTDQLEKTVAQQKTTLAEQKKIVRRLDGDSEKQRSYIGELEQQLSTLKDQIEKLKTIDLQIENVKRQAAPPEKPVQ